MIRLFDTAQKFKKKVVFPRLKQKKTFFKYKFSLISHKYRHINTHTHTPHKHDHDMLNEL